MPSPSSKTSARNAAIDPSTQRAASGISPGRLVAKVLHTAKMLIVGHVQIKREGKNIFVSLQEQPKKNGQAVAVTASAAEREVQTMRQDLAEVLDHHPGTRHTLRHLAVFEKKFKHHGLQVLDTLPVELLQKARQQLDTLCEGVATAALTQLRSKMDVAMMEREQVNAGPPTVAALSNFNTPDRLQVVEVGVSDFVRANEEFAGSGAAKAA